jgi:hypothetical protein
MGTNVQQEEQKMKRDKMKKRKRYRVWFKVSFDPMM